MKNSCKFLALANEYLEMVGTIAVDHDEGTMVLLSLWLPLLSVSTYSHSAVIKFVNLE